MCRKPSLIESHYQFTAYIAVSTDHIFWTLYRIPELKPRRIDCDIFERHKKRIFVETLF